MSPEAIYLWTTLSGLALILLAHRLGGKTPILSSIGYLSLLLTLSIIVRGVSGLVGLGSSVTGLSILLVFYMKGRHSIFEDLIVDTLASIPPILVSTTDIVRLYIYWEIMTALLISAISARVERGSVSAGLKYLLFCGAGSLIALIGLVIGVQESMSTDIRVFLDKSSITARILLLTGLGAEASIFPLYMWLPDYYSEVNPLLAAMISSWITPVSGFVIGELASFNHGSAVVIATLASLSSLVGSIAAYSQKDLGRLLGYSSISHTGYITTASALGGPLGLSSSLLHALAHSLAKSPVFLLAGALSEKSIDVDTLSSIGGRASSFTVVASSLGLLGLPPALTFWSEILILSSLGNSPAYFTLLAVSVIASAGYSFKLLYTQAGKKSIIELGRLSIIPLALAVLSIALSIAPFNILGYFLK
ncbi:proton-conducting transporter transmembrane domain-containing protein [Thermogladius sp. 4427co]|uniref:proton-conducting transporter transmembrane domain-containing protein n=1 Tax=Thermogladius sp. 4427co TaxID=3450718 RepID=UPI003F79CE80